MQDACVLIITDPRELDEQIEPVPGGRSTIILEKMRNWPSPWTPLSNERKRMVVGSDASGRERVLKFWHRSRLKEEIPPLIAKWEAVIGVAVAGWGVKQMKTRWGTCNIEARCIWLNLELIKKPVHCLEYIVVHEMVHLLERHHNERFVTYMNGFMPLWQFYREELNRAPLGEELWEY